MNSKKTVAKTVISSRNQEVRIGSGEPVLIVGERINPTGKPKLEREIRQGKLDLIKAEAIRQVKCGAGALDVNLGAKDGKFMSSVIQELQKVVSVPLFIDSQDPKIVAEALKVYTGKAVVNSVSGRDEVYAEILPLVKQNKSAVVGLTIDKGGIPETAVERLKIAQKIIKAAESYNIRREDVLIDSLVLPMGVYGQGASVTLEALKLIKKELGVTTILGISNISYGLPGRKFLNQAFLCAAIQSGLDVAIVDPCDKQLMGLVPASALLGQPDLHARTYIRQFRKDVRSEK